MTLILCVVLMSLFYPGIGIAAAGMRASPRLPLLGLRGLDRADLEVMMRHRRVTIRTPRRFWFF